MAIRKPKAIASKRRLSLIQNLKKRIDRMKIRRQFESKREKQQYLENLAKIKEALSKAEATARRTSIKKKPA